MSPIGAGANGSYLGRVHKMTRVAALLVTTASLILSGCHILLGRLPTDGELQQRFHEHRQELEQLVAMFKADKGLGRVGGNFTRPDDPSAINVSSDRISEYRRLCSVVGSRACIEGYDAESYRRDGVALPPGFQPFCPMLNILPLAS